MPVLNKMASDACADICNEACANGDSKDDAIDEARRYLLEYFPMATVDAAMGELQAIANNSYGE